MSCGFLKKSLASLAFALVLLAPAALPARAADSWLDRAQDGGLKTIGSDVYGQTGEPDKPLQRIVTTIIRIVLGFLGLLFVIMIIVSGFQYMTAGGNDETVKKATMRIRNAIIGLLIVLCAYSITYFVTNRVAPVITNGR